MSRFTLRPIPSWKDKLITTAILLAVVVGMRVFSISCPFLAMTGLPCPTCGMTRAWIAALSLDYQTAFSYHPLFWTVPILYLCFLYDGRLFQRKWIHTALYILLGAAFAVHWAITLFPITA